MGRVSMMLRLSVLGTGWAGELSRQASGAAQTGDETMTQLTAAMRGINESSGEISKIIKVIEEIAFQTNLLALNAAVEAARAGEHGKGFAVVADEVRNLSQRAAQAARETARLIEGSVGRAKEGDEVARAVAEALSGIVGDVTQATELMNDIARASDEQAQGVDQLNTAVSQMDHVTQQNAAGAEELASSASEMGVQAGNIKGMVSGLQRLVGASGQGRSARKTKHLTGQSKAGQLNCWDVKKCGRTPGDAKAEELGVCPAYPDHGKDCWAVAGTLCGGKVQGSAAAKLDSCMECQFYQDLRKESHAVGAF